MGTLEQLVAAKAERDAVTTALVKTLRNAPALPPDVEALLRAYDLATVGLRTAVTSYTNAEEEK